MRVLRLGAIKGVAGSCGVHESKYNLRNGSINAWSKHSDSGVSPGSERSCDGGSGWNEDLEVPIMSVTPRQATIENESFVSGDDFGGGYQE